MTTYPDWTHRLVEIDALRKAVLERAAELEAKAAAAQERMLGVALVEVLAFVLDVALPAPDRNEIVLDGIHFWLDESDVEPISERDGDGAPTEWHFTLHVEASATLQRIGERTFQFGQGSFPTPDLHAETLSRLSSHVLELIDQMRMREAVGKLTVGELVSHMKWSDALRAAEAAEVVWVDCEFDGSEPALSLVNAAFNGRDDISAPIRTYLLS